MFHLVAGQLRFLLVHPGGPFWRHKDLGAWSIPKGEVAPNEDPLAAACREFQEEIGVLPSGPFHELPSIQQKGGKRVQCWAVHGHWNGVVPTSNLCRLEIPAGSGKWLEFPEVDRAEWFPPDLARKKINPAQVSLLEAVEQLLNT